MLKDSLQYQDYLIRLFPEYNEGHTLNEDEVDDVEILTKEQLNALKSTSVKTFTFQVTENCSLRCTYCYQAQKKPNYMDFETAKKAIDYLFEHKDEPDFYFYEKDTCGLIIEFIGGEPLLCMDVITKICDYFEDKCLQYPDSPWLLHHRYSFSTNGVAYFDKDVQDYLAKYGQFVSMSVTIDGCKELHDSCRLFPNGEPSYDIAIKAALQELKNGNDATKITLSPPNIGYVFKGVKNMLELGFRHIHINSAYEEGWVKDDAKKLYEQLKLVADYIKEQNLQDKCFFKLFDTGMYHTVPKIDYKRNWCGTVGSMLALDYKGKIFSCLRFMESSLDGEQEPYSLGDVDNGIGSTEAEKKRIKDLNSLTRDNTSTKECLECPIGNGCSWCAAYDYQHFGTIFHRATYICDNHKAGALGAKYFYKITNDKENYDKIEITKELALDIITEEEWNKLQWEE